VRHTDLDLKFRSPRASDEPFIVRIGRRVFARWSKDPAGTLASMMRGGKSRVIIAEQAEQPIGFAVVEIERLEVAAFGPFRAPAVARLDAIAVDPTKQGMGAGRLLLEEAERLASEERAVVMMLMTALTNRTARELFLSGGYLPLTQLERRYSNGDAAVEMFKLIG
jgi:ribosomal protein S18 acetylase RimI-like enzyme